MQVTNVIIAAIIGIIVSNSAICLNLTNTALDVFISSIDTTGNKKTKKYIVRKLKKYIEAVGPNNVTQICSNNASTILGALDDLVATYPHLYKQGCCTHILNLLLEDWKKEKMFKTLIIWAKRVYIYI